jgi:nitrogen fixation NifU-like protein
MAYDMYQEVILQHYRAPHHFGPLSDATAQGEESNPLCGDHITFRLKVDPSTQRVDDAKFEGDGCAISMASASMLSDKLAGRPLAEVLSISRDEVLGQLGIPLSPARVRCALTGFVALGKALHPEATR